MVIGLSNYRGHCFTVPCLVPLLNDISFITTLLRENAKLTKDDLKTFNIIWALFLLYTWYSKASKKGPLVISCTPSGYEKEYHPRRDPQEVIIEKPKGEPKPCLWIDRALMKLLKCVGTKQANSFLKPGGHETYLFSYIMAELEKTYENKKQKNAFSPLFMTKIYCTIYCKSCDVKSKLNIERSFIRTDFKPKESVILQDLVNNPTRWLRDEIWCPNENGEETVFIFEKS